MIARSLIVCAAALLAWHLAMPRMPRQHHTIPGQLRANHFTAQNYVLHAPAQAGVIAGSSMSDRLDASRLGPHHVKLTFPGGGPLTAMEIIGRSGRVPAVLWIESNLITRDADRDLVEDATAPWRLALRDASPVFTEDGRPSAYGVGISKTLLAKACARFPVLAGHVPTGGGLDAAVMEGMMKENRAKLSIPPDPADLARRVQVLGGQVDALEAKGCKVVFFEMPVDASLRGLKEPVAVRAAMKGRFPEGRYRWLDLERAEPWKTTDGIHLPPEEAAVVAERMADFEKSLDGALKGG